MNDTRENRDPDPLRLYGIIRADLNMSRGKMGTQLGHAYLDAGLECLRNDPNRFSEYKIDHGIKIALTAKSEVHLTRAYEEASAAGIPCALITDLAYFGYPEHMLGKPIVTALGIGPARRSETDRILKRFQLIK